MSSPSSHTDTGPSTTAGRLPRALRFVAPVAIASMAAALLAGFIEGAVHLDGWLTIASATGFSAPYALALGLVVGSLARAMWAAWRPAELAANLREEPGGVAPRLAGWLSFTVIAAALVGGFGFNFTRWLAHKSQEPNVVGLASALGAVAIVALLVVISRPLADLLAGLYRRLFRALAPTLSERPRALALLQPVGLLIIFAGLASVLAYVSWRVSFVPRIGHLHLGVELYLSAWLLTLAVVYAGVRAYARRTHQIVAGVALALACIAVIGLARSTRASRPALMLDIWGTETVSGLAVDLNFDLKTIRAQFIDDLDAPAQRPGETPRDVFLLTIDTVRANQLPMYGGEAEMPKLARFARSSTVFDWAFSPSNVTRRSLPAIITGLNPVRIRGRLKGWALVIDPRHILLAERFRASGYDTAGFFCCRTHFDKATIGTTRGIDHLVFERNEQRMLKRARKWLETARARPDRKPLFTWIHVYAPHDWHVGHKRRARKDKDATYESSYQRSLAVTDRWLGPLFDYLERPAVKRSTIVAVTSDHGEALGDRGVMTHSAGLFNGQIHVPLLIRVPELRARRIARPVSLIATAPTLLELAGFDLKEPRFGDASSLAPLVRGASASGANGAIGAIDASSTIGASDSDEAVVLSHQVQDRSIAQRIDVIIIGRHKLIVPDGGPPMLFDYIADPGEKRDLASEQPERVEAMSAELRTRLAELSGLSPYD